MNNRSEQLIKEPELRKQISCSFAYRLLAHTLPSSIIILALWIPFGFALTGLIEEWWVLGLFTDHGLFFFATADSPIPAHALRPLTILPQAIAYYLDPYSFKYWHVLLILALLVKGGSFSYITAKTTDSLKLGMIAGMLILVYPADTMQLSFRSLHINWALALVLMATVIFLSALDTKNKIHSCLLSLTSAAILASACAMYEASLLLAIYPQLMILVKYGLKKGLIKFRNHLLQTMTWWLGPVVYVLYVWKTAPLIASYQSAAIGTSDISQTLMHSLPKLFTVGLLRSALGGWFDALRITTSEYNSYWYALGVLCALAITIYIVPKIKITTPTPDSNPSLRLSRLILASIALIFLGYSPFLLSVPHQYISQRTFLFATPGAALLTTGLIFTLKGRLKAFPYIILAGLIFAGISTQLYQFYHYVKISDRQNAILKQITKNFDGNLQNKTLLILDRTNQIGHTWMFPNENLRGALTYLYGHTIKSVEVCHIPANEWQQADTLGRKGSCEETSNEWIFHYPSIVSGPGLEPTTSVNDKKFAKSDIIAILVDPDSAEADASSSRTLVNSAPKNFHDENNTHYRFTSRHNLPKSLSFKDEQPNDRFYWGFGNWWSMELPTAGSGWREAEWTVNSFYHESSAWKTNETAELYFQFAPKEDLYHLKGYMDSFVKTDIKNSMKITINGDDIPFQWVTSEIFEATLSKQQLKNGVNSMIFKSGVDLKYYGFSSRLHWVEIKK